MTTSIDHTPDLLILTFPTGGSLSRWEQFGVLDRELGFLRGVGRAIPRILCVSTSGADERRIAAELSERTGVQIDAISEAEPDADLGDAPSLEQRVLAAAAGVRRVVLQTIQFDDDGVALRLLNPLRRTGIRVALVARGSFIESRVLSANQGPHHYTALIAAEKEGRICNAAQIVAGTSHAMLDELCWKHGIHLGRTRVLNQPVAMPEDPLRLSSGRADDRVVTTGRFSGGCTAIRLAIEAVGLLAPTRREALTLEIIGDGPDGRDLHAYAESLGVRAVFRRGVNHPELINTLAQATIFLQAENARRQSITVLEAMALGCPVIVSDLPEYNGLIENGSSGIRVIQEARAYAFAIDCMLGDKGFRSMMGDAAHTKVAFGCDPEHVIAGMLSAYSDAIEAAPKQGEGPARLAS